MIELARQDSSSNLDVSLVDTSNKVVYSLETDLYTIIKEKIQDSGLVLKLGLTSQEVYIIELFLTQQCQLFGDIGKQLSVIVKDGRIDATDIPHVVLLIKDVFNMKSINMKNFNITVKDVVDFIENILLILLQSGIIQTSDSKLVENILKSSVVLLESTIDMGQPVVDTVDCTCSFWPF
jgi:hypothetical protein